VPATRQRKRTTARRGDETDTIANTHSPMTAKDERTGQRRLLPEVQLPGNDTQHLSAPHPRATMALRSTESEVQEAYTWTDYSKLIGGSAFDPDLHTKTVDSSSKLLEFQAVEPNYGRVLIRYERTCEVRVARRAIHTRCAHSSACSGRTLRRFRREHRNAFAASYLRYCRPVLLPAGSVVMGHVPLVPARLF